MSKDGIKFTIDWYEGELPEDWKTHLTVDFGSEDERKKYLYGEWKVEPLNALVLYSKGNRSSMKHLYGTDNVDYVNTSYQDVVSVTRGYRYKEIIIFDDGVKKEDIDIAMDRKWEG